MYSPEDILNNLNLTDMVGEEWKFMNGFEDIFMISNFGRVKSLKRKSLTKTVIAKQQSTHKGYLQVVLSLGAIKYNFTIHKCVYESFIGSRPKGYDIHHIDENKINNMYTNLEIIKSGLHSSFHKTGEKHHLVKITDDEVKEIYNLRLKTEIGVEDVADLYGISAAHVSAITRGAHWQHLGLRPFIKRKDGIVKFKDEL